MGARRGAAHPVEMRPTVCCLLLAGCFTPVPEVDPVENLPAPPAMPAPVAPGQVGDAGPTAPVVPCSAATCHGCCAADGSCVGYGDQGVAACGQGGRACDRCPGATQCKAGACLGNGGCSADCAGCCSGNTCVAVTVQSETSCGARGDTCERCIGGALCTGGACKHGCNATNCPDGCCQGTLCVPPLQQTAGACGGAGSVCGTCAADQACTPGLGCRAAGSCGPSNCAGCCEGDRCVTGSVDGSCGAGGLACRACASGTHCEAPYCIANDSGKHIGAPCTTDEACRQLVGTRGVCKHATTSGVEYPGGHCTLPCGVGLPQCPAGASACLLASTYGEMDRICLASCKGGYFCRQGYACYVNFPWDGCWLDP